MNAGLIKGSVEQQWQAIRVADVVVRERQRHVRAAHVADVRESFRELGGQLQLQPIMVTSEMVLIDGAHRLQAAKEEGWELISAVVLSGVDNDDRALLEAEANRVRLQLSPIELEDAWKTLYEPAYKARVQQNKVANLKRGDVSRAPEYSGARETRELSLPQAVKEVTGLGIDTLNKITDIRAVAESETASPRLKAAALEGLKKLSKPGAPVEPVHKALLKLKEQEVAAPSDPAAARARYLESRLDRTVSETTLFAERLDSDFADELREAASVDQVSRESLRAVRVALTHSLAVVAAIETGISRDAAQHFAVVNAEVSRQFSEQALGKLEELTS